MKMSMDKERAAMAIEASLTGEAGRCLTGAEILRYIEGPMEKDERLRLDRHLDLCALCSDAVEGAEKMSFHERHSILNQDYQPEQAPRRPMRLLRSRPAIATMLLAASVAVAIGVWQMQGPAERADLFTAHFQPYPNTIPLVRSSSAPTPLEEAMQAYELTDYTRAEALLAGVLKAEPDNATAWFYHGICLLTQNRVEDAIESLDRSARVPAWQEASRWFQALGYVRMGEVEKARDLLRPIAESNGFFVGKARALLEDIEPVRKR